MTMTNAIHVSWPDVQDAAQMARRSRRRAIARLNDLFRAGQPVQPLLQGRYAGRLLAVDLMPGMTQAIGVITRVWMPWRGKTFNQGKQAGDNVFARGSYFLSHVYWPLYRGYVKDGPETYRSFAFHTWAGPGVADPDRTVLKIDYNLPGNPRHTIRRVVDEIVQIEQGKYLGKAHLQWWWGRWQTVAYFTLEGPGA